MTRMTHHFWKTLPAAACLLALTACGSGDDPGSARSGTDDTRPSDDTGEPGDGDEGSDDGGSGDDGAGGTAGNGSGGNGGFAALSGADVEAWAGHLADIHGVAWDDQGAEEPPAEGIESLLRWVGDTGGGASAPSFAAAAVTNTDRELVEISCSAAAIPEVLDGHVEFLVDCVNSAGIEGVEPREVELWITDTFGELRGSDDIGLERTVLGSAEISLMATGDTATVGVTAS
ncbi:hypothetical protein [Streptomyces sp. SM12]|uniref:hypothetical protein n=1 Tax=Streptomyces sp. SM12 TaxID=1071602 RepID=UPI0011B0E2BA|nr:hypothetical protein [Streptomyces sp. SM12]